MENESNTSTPAAAVPGVNRFQPLRFLYKMFFWIFIAEMVFVILNHFLQPDFVPDLGGDPAEIVKMAISSLTAMVQMGLTTTALVFFYIWVYRACKNLYAFGHNKLKFSPGWSVGWFFIPVVNLVMPFLVMLEILKKSGAESRTDFTGIEHRSPSLLWVILWWTLHLISLAAGTAISVFMVVAILKAYIRLNWIDPDLGMLQIVSLIFVLARSAAEIMLLRQITNLQESRSKEMQTVREASL